MNSEDQVEAPYFESGGSEEVAFPVRHSDFPHFKARLNGFNFCQIFFQVQITKLTNPNDKTINFIFN